MGSTKMENQYAFSETPSEEIDNIIEKDLIKLNSILTH
jgi:hypothetical protein